MEKIRRSENEKKRKGRTGRKQYFHTGCVILVRSGSRRLILFWDCEIENHYYHWRQCLFLLLKEIFSKDSIFFSLDFRLSEENLSQRRVFLRSMDRLDMRLGRDSSWNQLSILISVSVEANRFLIFIGPIDSTRLRKPFLDANNLS